MHSSTVQSTSPLIETYTGPYIESMAAETSSKDQPFRILDLPAELRGRIYYFAVVDGEPIYIIDQTQQQYAVY